MTRALPLLLLVACEQGGGAKISDVPTVEVTGTLRVLGFNAPAPDVLACALKNDDNCVRSASDGSFTLELPAEAEVAIALTHRDFQSVVLPMVTTADAPPPFTALLWANDTWSETLSNGGVNWSPGTGGVLLWVKQEPSQPEPGAADPGAADVAVTIDPAVRGYYFDDSGVHLDGVLSRTTDAGMVGFFGLPDNEATLDLFPASGDCTPRELSWSAGVIPTLADHVTFAVHACAPAR